MKYLIDNLDKKILKQLLLDGRRSFVELAKDCGASAITVGKHFNKLKKEGIITGSTLQINYRRLGLNTVFNMSFKIRPDHARDTYEKIIRMKNLFSVTDFQKTVSAVFTLRNHEELNVTKEELKKIGAISGIKTYLWTDIRNQRENLDIFLNEDNKNASNLILKEKSEREVVDELDIKLIDILSMNSRMPFREVAKQLGTAVDTISRRYERLRLNQTIKAIIQINPQKLGYHASFCVGIAFTSEGSFQAAFNKLVKSKNCTLLIRTSGELDLLLQFYVKNLEELLEIQENIEKTPNVVILESGVMRCENIYPSRKEFVSTI